MDIRGDVACGASYVVVCRCVDRLVNLEGRMSMKSVIDWISSWAEGPDAPVK